VLKNKLHQTLLKKIVKNIIVLNKNGEIFSSQIENCMKYFTQ